MKHLYWIGALLGVAAIWMQPWGGQFFKLVFGVAFAAVLFGIPFLSVLLETTGPSASSAKGKPDSDSSAP